MTVNDRRFALILLAAALALGAVSTTAQMPAATLLADYHWRSIGPGNFSGRIADVEALDDDFRFVLVASASGGVWKSVNAGTTWTPIFDRYGSASIGDVAVFQKNRDIIWVGTGEANNRNSVAWGDGVYKSTDGGQTFTHVGLADTYQIARIVLDPVSPDVAYVAAIGDLWGPSGERGVFKTADGGKTWRKLTTGLPADGRTGATDLVMDPRNPNVLYAAFYERIRHPWVFLSGGPNGGIFKTADGGRTWRRLTRGLPEGPTGRIGLAVARSNPRVVMAIVEHGYQPQPDDPAYRDMTRLGSGVYRSEDAGATWTYVNRYDNRPFYYSQIRINPTNDQDVYVLSTSFRTSHDGGKTFLPGGPAFGGNYDYHAMWLDPRQHDRFYLGKDKGLTLTEDHGASFVFFDNLPVAQYYAIGVDMREPYYIYGGTQDNGSWGGPSFARDAFGIRNDVNWKMHWGDGMHAVVDPADWRKVYTEAENASLRLYDPLTHTEESRRPTPENVLNFEQATGVSRTAGADALRDVFRFNWQSPLMLSPHNPSTLYLGGNYLFTSADGGKTWLIISPDLSNNDPAKTGRESGGLTPDTSGAEAFETIVSLSESPILPGLIWAGTDDGNVDVTRDGGRTWTKVSDAIPGVPKGLWVSDVEASGRDLDTAYVAFDGHLSDNFETWVFKTSDGGRTWTDIAGTLLKRQPVHVLTEDPQNPDLLFLGTEFGAYVSLDAGTAWAPLMNGLPTVAVHDLAVHPRDRDLVAATHGRGIFILDDLTALEQATPKVLAEPAHVFDQRPATLWVDQSRGGQYGDNTYAGENPPSVAPTGRLLDRAKIRNTPVVTYYVKEAAQGPVTLRISDVSGGRSRTLTVPGGPGIHRVAWDGHFDRPAGAAPPPRRAGFSGARQGPAVEPGTYRLELTVDGTTYAGTLEVREDPILRK